MADISVKLDTHELVERMDLSAREIVNAMRRTVDRSARAARKDAIKTLSQDIGRPASEFRDAVPPVQGTTQGNLSATWTIKRKKLGILKTGAFLPIMSWNRGSFKGSTFRLTGGGSASLDIPKAFIIEANGGRALMVRTGPGRKDFKAVYAEMPNTGMGQGDAAARKVWQDKAGSMMASELPAQVQKALDGQHISTASTGD